MTQHTDGTKQNKYETDIGRETELKVRTTLKKREGALSSNNPHQRIQLNSTGFILRYSII